MIVVRDESAEIAPPRRRSPTILLRLAHVDANDGAPSALITPRQTSTSFGVVSVENRPAKIIEIPLGRRLP